MSKKVILAKVDELDYPDGRLGDLLERQIAATLPPIAGLLPGMSQEQRLAVLGEQVAVQRAAFVGRYGDPFGCERRDVVRNELLGVPADLSLQHQSVTPT